MSIKNIFSIVLAVLLTIIIMQNTDTVKFNILFWDTEISKVAMLGAIAVIAFILGVLVGRPKNKKYDIEQYHDSLHENDKTDTLSDEDRDYIS
ncbi:LapA family protein [Mucilaginibacter segetis]|uniref:DUF1049 domain-containing protein n=1 Tax=Mucilaginibacter segetis TaxID=2793071 RepID=A0A934PWP1_9SPHI|nr:lipopolysaccharide assembly protein LapA domain-containing protein [Mucilaginibacter segetis]MBK0380866.1 DUF1049 domain-containing protein [Mucilaginibacter segetis]